MLLPLENWQGREVERLHALATLARRFRPYTEEEAMEVAKLQRALNGDPVRQPQTLADFEKEWLNLK
jgi:hypothetical protein